MDEKRRRFEALAMPHLDAAYNLARWLTRGGAEADDIVQDAMLRAFRSFDGFRGEAVRPWLLAIVRNCHRSALEQRKRHAATPLGETDDTEIAAEGPTP
ncbi:MAG TPA: sigma-70 family RNA polymerase sigma factor, partial [Rhizomicrobium sp.]|nr:sigma-70 family RNA polymerase sigma factor [Rhizomicrobium sp.]